MITSHFNPHQFSLNYIMKSLLLLFILISFSRNIVCVREKFPLTLLHEWKIFDVQFPSDDIKQQALESGQYIPKNMIPVDVEVEYATGKYNICTLL